MLSSRVQASCGIWQWVVTLDHQPHQQSTWSPPRVMAPKPMYLIPLMEPVPGGCAVVRLHTADWEGVWRVEWCQ